MKQKAISISLRITLSILLAFSLIFAAVSIAISYFVDVYVTREAQSQLRNVYEEVAVDPTRLWSGPADGGTFLNISTSIDLAVFTEDGRLVYSKYSYAGARFLPSEGFTEVQETGSSNENYEGPDHFLIYRSSVIPGPTKYVVQVSKDLEDEDRFLLILKELLVAGNLVGIVLSFLVGSRIGTRILKPVDTITRQARSISAKDLSGRIPQSASDDEISRLISAFNEMLDRLDASFARQQRFVADASHELRTPLSVIQGYAAMLQRWAKSRPDLMEESLTSIREETVRMKSLVDRLLFLAQSDSGEIRLEITRCSLPALLRELREDCEASGISQTIEIESEEAIDVNCDRDLIRRMIMVCVDNAAKYSSDQSTIGISARKDPEDQSWTVSIRDQGVGIDAEHLPNIFDRFYRADESRNRSKGGVGLGLSLAREICSAHGGTASVISTPGVGSEFTFRMPAKIT